MAFIYFFKSGAKSHKWFMLLYSVLLMCSISILLFLSIFADSASLGEKQEMLRLFKGACTIVENVSEQEVPLFTEIQNAELLYEEGSIYIIPYDRMETDEISIHTLEIAEKNKIKGEVVRIDSRNYMSYYELPFVFVLKAVLSAVSFLYLLLYTFIYTMIRKNEIEIFCLNGMSKNDITKCFVYEILILYFVAILVSFVSTIPFGKWLIDNFFYYKIENYGAGTVVFNIKWSSIIEVLLFTLLSVMISLFLARLFSADEKNCIHSIYARNIDNHFITKFHSFCVSRGIIRNKSIIALMIIASIPISVVISYGVSLCHYEYEQRFGCDFIISDYKTDDVSSLELIYLKELQELEDVSYLKGTYYNYNYAIDFAGADDFLNKRVCLIIDYDMKNDSSILISKSFSKDYPIGSIITLMNYNKDRFIEVSVQGYKDDNSNQLSIYVSQRWFEDNTGIKTGPRVVYVYLNPGGNIDIVEEFISEHFIDYSNENKIRQDESIMTKRLSYIVYSILILFLILFVFTYVAALLYLFCKENNTTLVISECGCKKEQICFALLLEQTIRYIICSILIFLSCFVFFAIYNQQIGPIFKINVYFWINTLFVFFCGMVINAIPVIIYYFTLNRKVKHDH